MKILLATTSEIKINAVLSFFKKATDNIEIVTIDCTKLGLPEQPENCGQYCTYQRMEYAKADYSGGYDILIAIENDIEDLYDQAHVRVERNNLVGNGISDKVKIPLEEDILKSLTFQKFSDKIGGYTQTVGAILEQKYGYNSKDWIGNVNHPYYQDRKEQIMDALSKACQEVLDYHQKIEHLKESLKIYPNFPKEDVDFAYFYSLFSDSNMSHLDHIMTSIYSNAEIDLVMPLESRGLVLGSLLSSSLGVTMIPAQKPGKIPGEKITYGYEKEYGKDTIEISLDLFHAMSKKKHYRILIVDDLIASGGSIRVVMDCLSIISKRMGFTYEIFIFALNDVPKLREVAREKIGQTYRILF